MLDLRAPHASFATAEAILSRSPSVYMKPEQHLRPKCCKVKFTESPWAHCCAYARTQGGQYRFAPRCAAIWDEICASAATMAACRVHMDHNSKTRVSSASIRKSTRYKTALLGGFTIPQGRVRTISRRSGVQDPHELCKPCFMNRPYR